MLKLLELDQSILEYLKDVADDEGAEHFTERKLRPIASVRNRDQQVKMFNKLIVGENG